MFVGRLLNGRHPFLADTSALFRVQKQLFFLPFELEHTASHDILDRRQLEGDSATAVQCVVFGQYHTGRLDLAVPATQNCRLLVQ